MICGQPNSVPPFIMCYIKYVTILDSIPQPNFPEPIICDQFHWNYVSFIFYFWLRKEITCQRSTIFLWDDQYWDPNIKNRDHLAGSSGNEQNDQEQNPRPLLPATADVLKGNFWEMQLMRWYLFLLHSYHLDR